MMATRTLETMCGKVKNEIDRKRRTVDATVDDCINDSSAYRQTLEYAVIAPCIDTLVLERQRRRWLSSRCRRRKRGRRRWRRRQDGVSSETHQGTYQFPKRHHHKRCDEESEIFHHGSLFSVVVIGDVIRRSDRLNCEWVDPNSFMILFRRWLGDVVRYEPSKNGKWKHEKFVLSFWTVG